jgi:hypothetical protein
MKEVPLLGQPGTELGQKPTPLSDMPSVMVIVWLASDVSNSNGVIEKEVISGGALSTNPFAGTATLKIPTSENERSRANASFLFCFIFLFLLL